MEQKFKYFCEQLLISNSKFYLRLYSAFVHLMTTHFVRIFIYIYIFFLFSGPQNLEDVKKSHVVREESYLHSKTLTE